MKDRQNKQISKNQVTAKPKRVIGAISLTTVLTNAIKMEATSTGGKLVLLNNYKL